MSARRLQFFHLRDYYNTARTKGFIIDYKNGLNSDSASARQTHTARARRSISTSEITTTNQSTSAFFRVEMI